MSILISITDQVLEKVTKLEISPWWLICIPKQSFATSSIYQVRFGAKLHGKSVVYKGARPSISLSGPNTKLSQQQNKRRAVKLNFSVARAATPAHYYQYYPGCV